MDYSNNNKQTYETRGDLEDAKQRASRWRSSGERADRLREAYNTKFYSKERNRAINKEIKIKKDGIISRNPTFQLYKYEKIYLVHQICRFSQFHVSFLCILKFE